MKHNNHIIQFVCITAMLALLSTSLFAQRETLWLRGLVPTSKSWGGAKTDLTSGHGYNFVDINVTPANPGDPGYLPSLGVVGAADNLTPIFDGHSDVLGIAHDYGGMILRELANQQPKLSALILDGVPNGGSLGIESIVTNQGGQTSSDAQLVLDRFQDIIAPEKCQDCNLYGAFESWLNEIESIANLYEDVNPMSPIVTDLNNNLPQVPYAVLYGTVNNFSIAQLMDSRAAITGYDPETSLFTYESCYIRQLEKLEGQIKISRLKREIRALRGRPKSVFEIALGVAGSSISPQSGSFNPSAITNLISQSIKSYIENQVAGLESQIAETEAEQEAIRMLICRAAQDYIAAEWELLLLQSAAYVIQEEEVVITYEAEFNQCVDICDLDVYYGDLPSNTNCNDYCSDWLDQTTTAIVYTIINEKHDGILLESEQQLAGAAKQYHLSNTNHFQEQTLFNDGVDNAMTDLFDGNAGAAFFVPKN